MSGIGDASHVAARPRSDQDAGNSHEPCWRIEVTTECAEAGGPGSYTVDGKLIRGAVEIDRFHHEFQVSKTSADQLDIEGAIVGLAEVKARDHAYPAEIWNHSAYLKNTMTHDYEVWVANGWTKADGKSPRNGPKLDELWDLSQGTKIEWKCYEHLDQFEGSPSLDDDLAEDWVCKPD